MRKEVMRKVLPSLAVLVLSLSACSQESAPSDRQEEVAGRGAEVMPFDLERTTHVFEPLADGGLQSVVADDPNDREQVTLIRRHLRKEARAFSNGDFSDPEHIHGSGMPGLDQLKVGYKEISVGFSSTATGAQIRYRTDSPGLVVALHAWFQAQLMDHGDHAQHGG